MRTAIAMLERCRALIERWDLPRLDAFADSLLGIAYSLDGRGAESLPLLEKAQARVEFGDAARVTRWR